MERWLLKGKSCHRTMMDFLCCQQCTHYKSTHYWDIEEKQIDCISGENPGILWFLQKQPGVAAFICILFVTEPVSHFGCMNQILNGLPTPCLIGPLYPKSYHGCSDITLWKWWETAGSSQDNWIHLRLWAQSGWLCLLYYRSVMETQLVGQIEGKEEKF